MDEITYGEMPALVRDHWREFPPRAWIDIETRESRAPRSILTDPEWETPEQAGLIVILSDN